MKIAANLKEHGYIYTWEQVQGRYKTLTTAFKKMTDHNRKSGNDPRKCSFQEELEDIMGKKPSSSPVATCSTSATTSSDEQLEETEKSEIPDESLCSQKKKKKKSASGEVIDFLKDYTEQQKEEKKEERKERKEMFNQKMEMMKMLIDAMKK